MLVLAKALNQKFAHQAGYALINGRWKKTTADMKGVKNAPKAAHPKAGGTGHKPFAMPQEDAGKLLYPAEKEATNKDIKNFNQKHVPNLLQHAASGDIAAILGSSYGVNTHGKKLALIANYLLEQMGSKEQVVAGQKAGEHPAISSYEREPENVAEVAEQGMEAAADAVQEEAKAEAEPAAEAPKPGEITMPQFESGKNSQGVRSAYEMQAQKVIDATSIADLEVVKTKAKSWKGITPNSKKLLNLYGQKLAQLKGESLNTPLVQSEEPAPLSAVEIIATSPAQPDTAEGQPAPKKSVAKKAMDAIDWTQFQTADHIKNAKSYNAQVDAIKAAGEVGNINGILAMTYGKNTYGLKVAKAANNALAALGYPDIKVVIGKDAVHPMLGQFTQAETEQKAAVEVEQQKAAKAEEGPQEGETRMGKTGMLVFKDGHWVKQGTDEPAKEQPVAGEFKKGQKLSISDMPNLPAGSVIQTYDKDGKPYMKVLLGHATAWPMSKKGEPLAKPFQAKQYLELMGFSGNTKTPDSLGYISGYHHSEHPTEVVSVGKPDHLTQKQTNVIKNMWNGVLAVTPGAGVFPTNTSVVIVTDPKKPSSGVWVGEKGDWGHLACFTNTQNEVYQQIMAGKTPSVNLAESLGLQTAAPEPGAKTFANPPQTGNEFIDQTCEDIQNELNAGNWELAMDNINDMVTVIRDDQQMIDDFHKVDLSAWVIEAVTAAKKQLGEVSVKSLPTPPQIKQERAPTPAPQLPEFADVAEFNEWAKTKGEAFIEQASTYYGSEEAFAGSEAGKLFDSWSEKSEAAAKSEQTATKHERKQEKKTIPDEFALWQDAFGKLGKLNSSSEAPAFAEQWLAENGSDAPHLVNLAEALADYDYTDLAAEYFIAGKKAWAAWWKETHGNEPVKPLISPIGEDMQKAGTALQSAYNVIADQLHSGEANPDFIDKQFNKIEGMDLSETGKVQMEMYMEQVNKWLVESGPQEGDTKQGKGGTLVFHNGHWILQQDMPETSANGSAGSEIVALKQALAGANGDDASAIGLEFIKDNHGDKGAYTTVIDNILKMNTGHVYAASEIGQAYVKKHGKPANLPIKPDVGFYSTEAADFQGYAVATTLAKDEASKKLLIEAMKYEQNATPGTTINGTKYKEYMAEVIDSLTAAPDKPKTVYDLGLVFSNAKDNLETLMAIQEYVAKKGDHATTYQDIVKAAGDNVNYIPVLQSTMKDSINMHGVPQGIPKADYMGDSMADADVLDGLSAMAMVAKYTESAEMKEAVLNSVKESAYTLMANQGSDLAKMSMTEHAVNTMIYVQDQISGKTEEPAPEPEVTAPELGNIDLKLLDDIKSIAETKTGLQKVVKASVACKEYYDANPDKVDAVSTIKSVLIINDFAPVAIDGILTAIKNTVAEEDAKKADEGPKEGDMKPGANGMLVLKNGHWVKAGPDEIPAPDFAALGLSSWQQEHYMKYADNLKAKLTKGGGTKGIIMQKGDGTMLVYGEFGMKIKVSTDYGTNAPGKNALAQYASMMLLAAGHKVKNGWNPEQGTYAMNGVAQVMKATAATSNPAENGLSADGPMEVKKYQWKKKEPISVDEWTVTGGNQGGSNDGMKMKDADGTEWYVKFPDNEDHAKAEVLAAKLYGAAGLSSQDAMIVTKDGKTAIASKWENIKKAKTHAALAKAKGMLEGFAVDAWLGNWDVVGLAKDNVQLKDNGEIHRVDAGGSLMFRAQGAKKEFGPVVTELESLMDPKVNSNSAAVFGGMTEADITASVAKVLAISDAKIAHMVNQYGPGDEKAKKELVETLIKRKEYLADKYPDAKKVLQLAKFKPEKISTPPDFLNWSGVGKSGPSSKEFLNQGNHDAAQAIYSAALTGDTDAIRGLTAPTFDKDTGAVTGQVPVLDHPSQHIKGYAMQAINEIKSQLGGHEAEQFRIGGDHPLYSMHEEYKPENWSGKDADKIGKLLVLGHPGIVEPEDLGLSKTTFKAGTLTTNTYAKMAQDVWNKLPMTQKQAVQAYTGSSYQVMNSGLWKGNPSAEAKAAAQALSGMGHEISPGTTFGRKFSLGSGDMAKLKASVGKVIMEPAIMSTSISPDVWSGNIHLKMTAGPGVKGIYAGAGSLPGGGSISHHTGEKEIILPPNTRLLITKVVEPGAKDADGFGGSGMTIIECIILPSV